MKDKLRNTDSLDNLSMDIFGYAQDGVTAKYDTGYAIEVMWEAVVWVGHYVDHFDVHPRVGAIV